MLPPLTHKDVSWNTPEMLNFSSTSIDKVTVDMWRCSILVNCNASWTSFEEEHKI
jgi:hypothetical protein